MQGDDCASEEAVGRGEVVHGGPESLRLSSARATPSGRSR